MQSLNNILAKYSFELELSLIVALFFLAKIILAKFFSFMQNKAKKTNIVWDDIIAYAIEKPAKIFTTAGAMKIRSLSSYLAGTHISSASLPKPLFLKVVRDFR